MSYKVFIPTAGIGSRLGKFTTSLNKSLVSVDNKPIISHIIDKFPKTCHFVVALGYKGNLVREFLETVYPDKTIEFINIDPYEGEKAGLGFTLRASSHFLKEPFIFTSCDTLFLDNVPALNNNWVGYSTRDDIASYRTIRVKSNKVEIFNEKGKGLPGQDFPYIGLCGIYDYELFWEGMFSQNLEGFDVGEISGLETLLKNGITAYKMDWYDAGNLQALKEVKAKFQSKDSPVILEKDNEAIWFLDEKVVKFSTDKNFIENRVKRSKELKSFIPKILDNSNHMYVYEKAQGEVFSKCSNMPLFQKLLSKSNDFWKRINLTDENRRGFRARCLTFYKDKTILRIEKFFNDFNKIDCFQIINGEKVPSMEILINNLNWEYISDGIPVRFHGDFHFENILWNHNNKEFIFLDWRQDFGGGIDFGDIYYDLAKLMHGLIISHSLIEQEHYKINWEEENVNFELKRFHRDVEFEEYLKLWSSKNNFDVNKIMQITALIYLNIAALHHVPYNYLLFALGKLMLFREINKS